MSTIFFAYFPNPVFRTTGVSDSRALSCAVTGAWQQGKASPSSGRETIRAVRFVEQCGRSIPGLCQRRALSYRPGSTFVITLKCPEFRHFPARAPLLRTGPAGTRGVCRPLRRHIQSPQALQLIGGDSASAANGNRAERPPALNMTIRSPVTMREAEQEGAGDVFLAAIRTGESHYTMHFKRRASSRPE